MEAPFATILAPNLKEAGFRGEVTPPACFQFFYSGEEFDRAIRSELSTEHRALSISCGIEFIEQSNTINISNYGFAANRQSQGVVKLSERRSSIF